MSTMEKTQQSEASIPNGSSNYVTANSEVLEGSFPDGSVHEGSVLGHAKELCVNKMGHTMVPPPEAGPGKRKFQELFNRHRLHTIAYCAVFWSFGMCVAFLGPTILDLECRISTLFSTMSWVFFSQSLFTLLGSACGGFFIQRIGNHLVLLISTAMLSITLAIIPLCHVLGMLTMVMAIMGFFMGTIDTVANISMIQLYGRNVAPFLQALYFSYGLGAFLSPMIAKSFLMNVDCTQMILNITNNQHVIDFTSNLTQPFLEVQSHSRIQYAFWIMSGLQVPVVILLVVLVVKESMGMFDSSPDKVEAEKNSYELQQPPNIQQSSTEATTGPRGIAPDNRHSDDRPPTTKEQMILVTLCTAIILFLYDGIQAGYGGYIFSYAVKSIHGMSSNEAAYLNACFWGTFAFGRLVSIGISTRLAPNFMLLCNIAGCFTAMVLMLSLRHNHGVLYIGTCIFGTFLSSIYPTAVTLAENYISVTSTITSILVVCAASGEMIMPVIIGHEFEVFGPVSVLVSGLVVTLLSVLVFVFLYFVMQTIARQTSERSFLQRVKNLIRPPLAQTAESNEDSGLLKHHVKYYTRMRTELSESSLAECDAALSDTNNIHPTLPQTNNYNDTNNYNETTITNF